MFAPSSGVNFTKQVSRIKGGLLRELRWVTLLQWSFLEVGIQH